MNEIVVGIAEGKVVDSPAVLITYALGSCVAVCLYDRVKKIAGMAHIVLPFSELKVSGSQYKYADTGIALLLKTMEQHGADRHRITAKIAGGAEMFKSVTVTFDIGKKNTQAVKKVLSEYRIPVTAEDIGKQHGRTLLFYSGDGKVTVRNIRYGTETL